MREGGGGRGWCPHPLSPSPHPRKGRGRLATLLVLLPSVTLFLAAFGAALDHHFPPNLSRLALVGTEILDRQDRVLALLPAQGGVWRFRADSVPPQFVNLLIAVEDHRFWHHPGVDPLALARATGQLVRRGRVVSGGSTLAMQAARLLEPRPRTLRAKLIEIGRALQLEARYGREGVLRIWLTLAPFGGNLEGIRAGSLAWFGVPPEALEPAQGSQSPAVPSACDPTATQSLRKSCATECWLSASAQICSPTGPCRCQRPAYHCLGMRRSLPPRCRVLHRSTRRWTFRCRLHWNAWERTGCRRCRRTFRS